MKITRRGNRVRRSKLGLQGDTRFSDKVRLMISLIRRCAGRETILVAPTGNATRDQWHQMQSQLSELPGRCIRDLWAILCTRAGYPNVIKFLRLFIVSPANHPSSCWLLVIFWIKGGFFGQDACRLNYTNRTTWIERHESMFPIWWLKMLQNFNPSYMTTVQTGIEMPCIIISSQCITFIGLA